MKEVAVNKVINYLKKNNACSEKEEKVFKYTLESLYSFITKTTTILLLSYFLGTFKTTFLLLLLYSVLRGFSFGIHASKNLYCWIISLSVYVVLPYIIQNVHLNQNLLLFLHLLGILGIILWAPADTPKRPLLNKRKRLVNKLFAFSFTFILDLISYYLHSYLLFYIVTSLLILNFICIAPWTYKVFHIPYRNYERFQN